MEKARECNKRCGQWRVANKVCVQFVSACVEGEKEFMKRWTKGVDKQTGVALKVR